MANEDSDSDSNDRCLSDLECDDGSAVSIESGIRNVTCHSDNWDTDITSTNGGIDELYVYGSGLSDPDICSNVIVGCNVFLGSSNSFRSVVTGLSANTISAETEDKEASCGGHSVDKGSSFSRVNSQSTSRIKLNGKCAIHILDAENAESISIEDVGQVRTINKDHYWETILKPDKDGDNLMFTAIILNKTYLCCNMLTLIPRQSLLQTRCNNMLQTALHLAALTDNADLVRRFLVAGVQVDKQDIYGNTALHIACKRKNHVIAETLLKPVSYIETNQNSYEKPVSYQPIPQNLEIRNFEGDTCFMIAANHGNIKMMDLLISKKANINVKDIKSGMSVLHLYTESARVEDIKYLLKQSDLDISAKTYSGLSPLEIANIRGHSYIAYMLLCAGAKPKLRPKDCIDFMAESDSESESL